MRSALPVVCCTVLVFSAQAWAQDAPRTLRAGRLTGAIAIDGRLDEAAWSGAEITTGFLQVDPREGAAPAGQTSVRVRTTSRAIIIGIHCQDPDPAGIVSYSVRRDAGLGSEDHVRIVIGPFMDGRSGYVFSVNPSGARYDALVNPGGESENAEWDGYWEAATSRVSDGWTAEIRIPVQTLSFKPGLTTWHFNVQRRVQRLLESSRWATPARPDPGDANEQGWVADGSAAV